MCRSQQPAAYTDAAPAEPFGDQFCFQFPLRRYQQDIVELCNQKLADGERELHIVAPPGSGKTIIGLQIVSQFKCQTLVVCPNTTIQSQWSQKLSLFFPADFADLAASQVMGTNEDRPLRPITIVTYQALSVPGREKDYLSELAIEEWAKEIAAGQSIMPAEAKVRIGEMKTNNSKAYKKELGRHTTRLRRKLADVLNLEQVLHPNALSLIDELKEKECRLVIFDECHHLTDYWAAVMTKLVDRLDNPTIVALTGTPPEKKTASQQNRYLNLVGAIDYQVATPALVKEGGLAPFQDLVFFTEPSEKELEFLRLQHREIHELLKRLSEKRDAAEPSPLSEWITSRMTAECRTGWNDFVQRSPGLAMAMARYLFDNELTLPKELEFSMSVRQAPVIDDWMYLLEDYALNKLKTSDNTADHELFDEVGSAVRKIGFALSERGIRKIASPVDRVLSFSQSKATAVARILNAEFASLEDKLRALVITDFEKLSATTAGTLKDVLDADAGSAFGAFAELLRLPEGQFVNPVLVTGNRVLVDSRIAQEFCSAAQAFLHSQQVDLNLNLRVQEEQRGYARLVSDSSSFAPRLYVGMVTALFERGITKCLIGTRGIFGEGWDSQRLNTVIDLTTATSPVSVKQLRGRGIRLSVDDPLAERKVANNWDVVCIAPELEKGLNDYQRFVRKHQGYFGIADDGRIECGVGHVHPSFSELTPNEVFASIEDYNREMLQRALVRDKIYELWQVGRPYENKQLGCVEISQLRLPGITPAHVRKTGGGYNAHVKEMRGELTGVWTRYGAVGTGVAALSLFAFSLPAVLAAVPILLALFLAKFQAAKVRKQMELSLIEPSSQETALKCIADAVLAALQERKFLPATARQDEIEITVRAGNTFRVFLDGVEPRFCELFVRAMEEALAPVSNQPYVIAKYEFAQQQDPAAFFKLYMEGAAQPEVASYHAVPKLLARSQKGRDAFERAWNEHVSPGFVNATVDNPEILQKYFGMGPSLAERLLWE